MNDTETFASRPRGGNNHHRRRTGCLQEPAQPALVAQPAWPGLQATAAQQSLSLPDRTHAELLGPADGALAGDGGDGTTAFGLKRTAFIKRVGQLTGGGSAKPHWTGNRSARGWAGWKMLTPEEVSTGQDGQSYCGRCEKPFEPLLAETYCPVCIAFA